MEKMNPEVKALWLEALKSGRYQQGRGHLRTALPDSDNKYCCLGVLCDLYDKVHGEDNWREAAWGVYVVHKGRSDMPSAEVLTWAGLHDWCGSYGGGGENLAEVNDNSSSFAKVIELIEEHF